MLAGQDATMLKTYLYSRGAHSLAKALSVDTRLLLTTKVFQVCRVVLMSAHQESTSRLSALWLRLKMASSVRWSAYMYQS